MEANEIQIGDWLYYKGQFNAFPFKVESITKENIGYHAEPNDHRLYYIRLSECKPIPLTAEILEKNGFKQLEEDSYICKKSDKEDDYSIVVDLLVPYLSYIRKDKMPKASYGGEIKFVHQLQHALRLAGIDKEIIL